VAVGKIVAARALLLRQMACVPLRPQLLGDGDESASPEGDGEYAYDDCRGDRHVCFGRRGCDVGTVEEAGLQLGRVECDGVERRGWERPSERAGDDRMHPLVKQPTADVKQDELRHSRLVERRSRPTYRQQEWRLGWAGPFRGKQRLSW
jgi:hypothetical protein